MRLVENARAVFLQSYVAWLVYIGSAVQIIFEFGMQTQLPGWVTVILLVLILIGRSVKQEQVSGPRRKREKREFHGEHGEGL